MDIFTKQTYFQTAFQISLLKEKQSPDNWRDLTGICKQHYHLKIFKQVLFLIFIVFSFPAGAGFSQTAGPLLNYEISIPQPASHTYQIVLRTSGWNEDTLQFKMPNWMPGYYQMMEYSKTVEGMLAKDMNGNNIPVEKINDNTWSIAGIKNKSFVVSYTICTNRQFVANSYVDNAHAYLIPENSFLYVEGFLQTPVSVKIVMNPEWKKIATGLEPVAGKPNEFMASDFDILYDCPILIGNLEELPSFKVKGIEHRFIGYAMVDFDRVLFMDNLKKVVEAAVTLMGDIPYKQYTFIGIGPGRGGIEHLNNTTISFDGSGLNTPNGLTRMMSFIGHEYFHHYNVKRIRPFELGPFDYDRGNKTNQLWVSEGLTVYYEYLILKRAGLMDAKTLLSQFDENINAVENNPGRLYQSLAQASYNTWSDGPFGTQGVEPGKSISYYDKGPVVGLFLDMEIRHATNNKKSLDDVMRLLYWKYYKQEQRGFTDAEFQQACEQVAGIPLTSLFEYVYTTKELDYVKYLGYAGLKIDKKNSDPSDNKKTQKRMISRIENPTPLQVAILNSWLGE